MDVLETCEKCQRLTGTEGITICDSCLKDAASQEARRTEGPSEAPCSGADLDRLRKFLNKNYANNGKNEIGVGLIGADADPVGRAIFVIRQYDEQLKLARK